MIVLTCLIISSGESDSMLGATFTGTLKRLWNGVQTVDDTHAYLIDLVQTGHHGIDSTIINTASFLKQLTTGTASELTLETYHKICEEKTICLKLILRNTFHFTGSANIGRASRLRQPPGRFLFKFILMTPCKNYTYSVTDVENMWKNEAFDVRKRTVVLVTGWLMTLNNALVPIVHTISKAYLCRGDVNFIVSIFYRAIFNI